MVGDVPTQSATEVTPFQRAAEALKSRCYDPHQPLSATDEECDETYYCPRDMV